MDSEVSKPMVNKRWHNWNDFFPGSPLEKCFSLSKISVSLRIIFSSQQNNQQSTIYDYLFFAILEHFYMEGSRKYISSCCDEFHGLGCWHHGLKAPVRARCSKAPCAFVRRAYSSQRRLSEAASGCSCPWKAVGLVEKWTTSVLIFKIDRFLVETADFKFWVNQQVGETVCPWNAEGFCQ